MKKYTQLTQAQRYQIAALKQTKATQKDIADIVGVHSATLGRELRRNKGKRGYRPKQAHEKALKRHKEKPKKVRLGIEQIEYIKSTINQQWSPEQISATMHFKGIQSVSHETIYKYLIQDRLEGGKLYMNLRHKSKGYQKRYGSNDRRGQIKDRVSIDERPRVVEEKMRIGDFEIDTVIGKNHKQALVTLVDRHSKFTLIQKVTHKRADMVSKATIDLLMPIAGWVHTITADNGKEFAHHQKIAKALKVDVYFAHPYSSWERGVNENTNGLIRQYCPKKSSFEHLTDEYIQHIQDKLNHRPRKTLGFKTPYEVFFGKISEEVLSHEVLHL